MAKYNRGRKWSRLSLSTDGRVIHVRHNNLDIMALTNLMYAILQEVPNSAFAMQTALEQYNKYHEPGKPGT
jgi:hypothetical protein